MSYPSWRIESWYEGNNFVGFRVVRGNRASNSFTIAPDGCFRIDPHDTTSKTAMRDLAIQMRAALTAQESDPRILAQEARDILRDLLAHMTPAPGHPNALMVPALPLDVWLKDRLDRLCSVLGVKDEFYG